MIRGHRIIRVSGVWVFEDTGEHVEETWESRPCNICNKKPSAEGHDHCISNLPCVINACCGHGDSDMAYIQYESGQRISGALALYKMLGLQSTQEQMEEG